jgi:anti-anti-sigma regulatory factor
MTRFDVWRDSGVGVILPIGDLDGLSLKGFRLHLGFAAEFAKIPATLLVDEGEILFMGSAAVHAMIQEHRRLQGRGGSFALAGREGRAATAIHASYPHTPDPFPIFGNIEEAVTQLHRLLSR